MNIWNIGKPGTEAGPCEEPCGHRDCATSRKMARQFCGKCGKEIGYEINFFIFRTKGEDEYLHCRCID